MRIHVFIKVPFLPIFTGTIPFTLTIFFIAFLYAMKEIDTLD